MNYQTIQPPFTLKFREMTKRELDEYEAWFHEVFETRIAKLEDVVRTTPGYESWNATFMPDSLVALGRWFEEAVTTRLRTREERDELVAGGDLVIAVPNVELTNQSFSFAIDVGMYLARTLERACQNLRWERFLDNKKFADYGQPVLTGFGAVPLNPIRIAVNLAYGIASGKQTGKRLKEVFDYWFNQATRRKH